MKMKRWLVFLLSAMMAFSALAFTACESDTKKPSGGQQSGGGLNDDDEWTNIH